MAVGGGDGGGGGPNLHALGLLDGAKGGPDPNAKAEDLSDFINKLFESAVGFIGKAVGVNAASIMNTGIFKHFNFQDAAIKTDNMMMVKNFDSQGGALANLAFGEIFTKGGLALQNMGTAASGGESSGGGGDGGGGGGGTFEAFAANAANSGMGEMFIAAGGGNNFEWRPEPMSSLGNFSSPTIEGAPVMAMGRGGGMELG